VAVARAARFVLFSLHRSGRCRPVSLRKVPRFLLFTFLSSFCFHGFGGRRIGKECVDATVGSYRVLSKESIGCCEWGHDAGWFLQNFYQTFGEH